MLRIRILFALAVCFMNYCSIGRAGTIGFTGDYDPSKWETTHFNSDGSVDTSNAPDSITLVSSDNGSFSFGSTSYSIVVPESGALYFRWSFTTEDFSAFYDPFGYFVDDNYTRVSRNNLLSQSGWRSVSVLQGQVFGFRIDSLDNIVRRSTVIVSKFEAVPEPTSMAAFGGAMIVSCLLAKRRRKGSAVTDLG
jgi:PEP-CTERM motif